MNRPAAAILAGIAMVLGGFLFAPGAGAGTTHGTTITSLVPSTRPAPQRESFCHRTRAVTHPYVFLTTSVDAIIRQGHDTHTGPLFPAPGWGDIIPPFTYGNGLHFPGLNWPAGASILANHCTVPGPPTTTTTTMASTTTTHATTTTTEKATTTTKASTTTTTEKATTTTGASTTTTTLKGTTTTTAEIRTLLTLRALVINHFGGTATAQDFSLEANGPVDLDGITGSPSVTLASVPPGSYQLRDRILVAAALGYLSSGWDCVGSASTTLSSVVLDAGEEAVCLIVFSDTGEAATTTTAPGATTVPGGSTTVPSSGTTVPAETATTTASVLVPVSTFTQSGVPAQTVTTTLPNTGYDPSRMLEGAGAALILGGAAVALSRRKRQD